MGCCLEGVLNSKKKSRNNNSKIQNDNNNSSPFVDEEQKQEGELSISRRQSKRLSVLENQKREQSILLKEKGNDFYKQNNFLEAIRSYSQAINLFPDSIYHSNRALCYRQLQNWAEVLKDACEAIRLDHENYKAYHLKGMAQVMLSKVQDLMSDQWEQLNIQGIKSMQKALDLINEIHQKPDFNLISTIQTNISKANQIFNLKKSEKELRKKNKAKQLVQKLLQNNTQQQQQQNGISNEEITEFIDRRFQKKEEKAPDSFLCIFTLDLMVNPVITSSGLSYEKTLLDEHIKANGEVDPTTRVKIDSKKCIENTNLKMAIQDFKSRNLDSEFGSNFNQINF